MRLEGMQRVGQALDRAFGCWAELLTNHVGIARLDVLDADDDGSPIIAAATKRGFSFLALDRAFIDPLFCRVPCRRVWIFAVATRALALSYVVRATLRVGANVGAGPTVVAVKPARRPIITVGPMVVAAGSSVVAVGPTSIAAGSIAARSAIKSGFFVAGHGTLTLPPGTDRGVRCPDQN